MNEEVKCAICGSVDLEEDGCHGNCKKCNFDLCFDRGDHISCHYCCEPYCVNCGKKILFEAMPVSHGKVFDSNHYCLYHLLKFVEDESIQDLEYISLGSVNKLIKNILIEKQIEEQKQLKVLKDEINQLKIQLRYRPGGDGYVKAKEHFEELSEKLKK